MTTVCLFLLLLSSSMPAHRTSHLTSLVLNSFLTALAPTLPLPGIYEGPGGGGVVKYSTFVHSCMHLPVLHPSGSLPHTFSFPLFISTYPLIYFTGEDKKNNQNNSITRSQRKIPTGKGKRRMVLPRAVWYLNKYSITHSRSFIPCCLLIVAIYLCAVLKPVYF